MSKKSVGIAALRERCENVSELARDLGITRGAINQWQQVPSRHVVKIEALLGIPRQTLRPDLYIGMPEKVAS